MAIDFVVHHQDWKPQIFRLRLAEFAPAVLVATVDESSAEIPVDPYVPSGSDLGTAPRTTGQLGRGRACAVLAVPFLFDRRVAFVGGVRRDPLADPEPDGERRIAPDLRFGPA